MKFKKERLKNGNKEVKNLDLLFLKEKIEEQNKTIKNLFELVDAVNDKFEQFKDDIKTRDELISNNFHGDLKDSKLIKDLENSNFYTCDCNDEDEYCCCCKTIKTYKEICQDIKEYNFTNMDILMEKLLLLELEQTETKEIKKTTQTKTSNKTLSKTKK